MKQRRDSLRLFTPVGRKEDPSLDFVAWHGSEIGTSSIT